MSQFNVTVPIKIRSLKFLQGKSGWYKIVIQGKLISSKICVWKKKNQPVPLTLSSLLLTHNKTTYSAQLEGRSVSSHPPPASWVSLADSPAIKEEKIQWSFANYQDNTMEMGVINISFFTSPALHLDSFLSSPKGSCHGINKKSVPLDNLPFWGFLSAPLWWLQEACHLNLSQSHSHPYLQSCPPNGYKGK